MYDETKLINSAKQGDRGAFDQLVLKYSNDIFRYAYRILRHEQDAQNASQDTFLKAWQGLKSFKGISKFSTWLYSISYNVCMNYLKKRKKEASVSTEDVPLPFDETTANKNSHNTTPEESYLQKERLKVLNEAIDKLPPHHKQMMILRFIEGFSYEEIAKITALPLGTVKSKISRARDKLIELLKKNMELFN